MRSITGRDLIIKIEGCYHGHHDSVQVSVAPEPEQAGPAGQPYSAPSSTGIPKAITDLTLIAAFNDLASVQKILDKHQDQVAGMILEPIMMNAGIIKPAPGYLQDLKTLLHRHHALLTFGEVKTGLTVGPGGAVKQQGVQHVVTAGAKGCVVFAEDPVTSYRGFLGVDDRYSHAHWLYQHNGGVFLPPWGKIEQWLISVQHDEADIDRLIKNFAVFARAVGGPP